MTTSIRSKLPVLIFILLLFAVLPLSPAHAAGIVVNTATDEDVDNGDCSLREAIIAANTDAAYNGCNTGSGADVITFAGDYTITLGSALPDLTTDITITGNGAADSIVQASTCDPVNLPAACTPASYRVFTITAGTTILKSQTIRHGNCAGACSGPEYGGGIFSANATVTLDAVTLSYNAANGNGGGLFNFTGVLTIQNGSLVDNNAAGLGGGGVYHEGSDASDTTTVSHSSVSNNTANGWYGAGIYAKGAETSTLTVEYSVVFDNLNTDYEVGGIAIENVTALITHSVIYDNTSQGNGDGDGGVGAWGPTTITNSTISGNTAPNTSIAGHGAAGLGVFNTTVTLNNVTITNNTGGYSGGISDWGQGTSNLIVNNSIIAGNSGGTIDDCNFASGTIDFNNVPSILQDATGCTPTNAGSVLNVDPLLVALTDNGGNTRTHALDTGSPAINASGAGATADDQRGVSAVGTRDLGAYENESTFIFADGFESGDFTAWFGLNTGNGDLNVCATAAVEGSYGACVDVVSNKRKQVWDRSMTDASQYRARFYFDPNGLSMGNNEKIRLMQLRTGVDTIRPAFVQVRTINGGYEIRTRAQTDAGVTLSGSWYPISDDWVAIEIDWMAATGDGNDDGYVTLWLGGVEKGTISGIDNDMLLVNEVKMGFTSRLGTKIISGTFYMDAFVSTLADYIGP